MRLSFGAIPRFCLLRLFNEKGYPPVGVEGVLDYSFSDRVVTMSLPLRVYPLRVIDGTDASLQHAILQRVITPGACLL